MRMGEKKRPGTPVMIQCGLAFDCFTPDFRALQEYYFFEYYGRCREGMGMGPLGDKQREAENRPKTEISQSEDQLSLVLSLK